MLIVVTILALLAGILIPILEQETTRARDGRRAGDLRSVASALVTFRSLSGTYPDTGDEWFGDSATFGSYGYDAAGYIPGLVPDFLPYLPKDPNPAYPDGTGAGYMYRSDGLDFKFVINATPSVYLISNPFFDPARPATGWQVSSPGGYNW
jgi:type II secretory pathway pseudopilin PulG